MTLDLHKSRTAPAPSGRPALRIAAAALVALSLGACKHFENQTRVAGWTLVDPTERHPILVSQQPETLTLRIGRGAEGLTPAQRSDIIAFAQASRATDAGNSRLVIAAPSGSANEVAAMHAVREVGDILADFGIAETDIAIEPYFAEGEGSPPLKVSFLRFVAEGPECGHWPTNLAFQPDNLPMPNLGCATQKNLASMVANPADLVAPRTSTSRPAERRLVTWEKFIKGEVTGAEKSEEEQVKVADE